MDAQSLRKEAATPTEGPARVDFLELVTRQLLIVRDAADTGLLLVQAMRQGRVEVDDGVDELEARLTKAAPATFMSPKPPEGGGDKQ